MATDDRYKTARRRQARRLGVLRKVALRGLQIALDPTRRLEHLRTISGEEWERAVSEGEAQGRKGGPGSGHFSHEGRPGQVGGSVPSGSVAGGVSVRRTTGATSAQKRDFSTDERYRWQASHVKHKGANVVVQRQGASDKLLNEHTPIQYEYDAHERIHTANEKALAEQTGISSDKIHDTQRSWAGMEVEQQSLLGRP